MFLRIIYSYMITLNYSLFWLNIFMMDAYTNAFYSVVKDSQSQTGFELPEHLEAYIVMLLANHIDKPSFLPEESFAIAYLKLGDAKKLSSKQLGDTCLFVCGVFPTLGLKKGLNKNYYANIGMSSYRNMHGQIFGDLADHFNFLSQFIEITVSSSKQTHSNLFR